MKYKYVIARSPGKTRTTWQSRFLMQIASPRLWLGLWLGLAMTSFCTCPAFAQNAQFSISPSLSTIYAKPGTSVKISYSIKNIGDPNSIVFKPVFLIPSGRAGEFTASSAFPSDIQASIDQKEDIFLSSNTGTKATVDITIAKNAQEKDYYLGLMVQTVGRKRIEGKSSVEIAFEPTSTVLLTVTKDGIFQNTGLIDSFSISKSTNVSFLDSTDPIPINLLFSNTGNNWMYARGSITVTDPLGKEETITIEPQRVLATAQRLLLSTASETTGNSAVLRGLHIGRYHVVADIQFEGQEKTQTKAFTFIALPFKLVGFLVFLVFIGFLVIVQSNHYGNRPQALPHRL